jgi:O-acetyl-ADP-ribose deacetylase (regulator of RNase III)
MTIFDCLQQLKKDNFKSIAFPAIGSGNLKYPQDLVVNTITDTCQKFLEENNNAYEIQIVVYEQNEDLFQVFQDKLFC